MKHLTLSHTLHQAAYALLGITLLIGCTDENRQIADDTGNRLPLEINGQINHEFKTRVNDQGFVNEDQMGVYIVDYDKNQPGKLESKGNHVDNLKFTYDETMNRWIPSYDVYWTNKETPIDVYGYYPYIKNVEKVNAVPFEVKADQRIPAKNGQLSAYEESDFLWAKVTKAEPGKPVGLLYTHLMAGVKVVLNPGTGFAEGEWEKLPKLVTMSNTVRKAQIDLATAFVKAQGETDRSIFLSEESDSYRGVVVPQVVKSGKGLISITIDGQVYTHKKAEDMLYRSGNLYQFTIVVNKREASGDFEFQVASEQLIPWVNDESSHDFGMNSYVVVNVEKAGELDAALKAQHISASTVTNLKIKGQLTERDFAFIRRSMPKLQALNLKETRIVDCHIIYHVGEKERPFYENEYELKGENDVLPMHALSKSPVSQLILPSGLKAIGEHSLEYMSLTAPLIIPSGVTQIHSHAFEKSIMSLELPESLDFIGSDAFRNATMHMECALPNTMTYIGRGAFEFCDGLYGNFYVPANLEYLGVSSFSYLSGTFDDVTIEIPHKIKNIWPFAFNFIAEGHKVHLKLHDDIKQIGEGAFFNVKFGSPVVFNEGLKTIDKDAFSLAEFVGDLQFPSSLSKIGIGAFRGLNIHNVILPKNLRVLAGDDINGVFEASALESILITDNIEQIETKAFFDCHSLRNVTIGKNVGYIDNQAFASCEAIRTLTCMVQDPPGLGKDVFKNVDFNSAILQVPENAVDAYRASEGWNQFKNISAYHDLVLNIQEVTAINKGVTREGLLRSEGEWYVESCPDWCELIPNHGGIDQRKTLVSVRMKELAAGAGYREDKIVIRLKDKDCYIDLKVRQYDYAEKEDTEIILQEATAGAREIPIFIVGDGFDAEQIQNGTYLETIKKQVEYLFSIEPYKSYKNYFTVITSLGCSPERGIQTNVTRLVNRFGTQYAGGEFMTDAEGLKTYAMKVSKHITPENLSRTTFVVIANTPQFCGTTSYAPDGSTLSICGLSNEAYPYDQRGVIQHEVGGVGFGKLGNERIQHFDFIQLCCCPFCNKLPDYEKYKAMGYYDNLTLSNKFEDLPWKHLFFHPKYQSLVDCFEGAYDHARGIYRSELNSCMRSYIPYYNTISRESIVKRIMNYAGLPYSFDEFVANDRIELPN